MLTIKDLESILSDCKNKCDSVGIKYGNVTKVIINTRKKSAFATCYRFKSKGKEHFEIEVIEVTNKFRTIEQIETTIMHELLHTVDDCFNHSPLWKKYASIVNRKFGYNVQTKTRLDSSVAEKINTERIKYETRCTCCGMVMARYMRKPTRSLKNAYHPACGVESVGKLKVYAV